ncbi:alanine--tRNA ligase [Aureibacter tunicatorum]|uniref:Alanine--tRNA ligase n=1 Tax=Aureibacter tunicatorum TaxID=866807 RepID=A0AAE3XQN2_9BACT|nr:alanine--tRNA ligase [Aureibacter tunicatorum]MDR6240875.1 alanyl-tRNA synthetase [Aureibacter tunicatorum]BDD03655.1 alanine--tRNA ligase [Aureibacter tunicatorum]
MDSKSIRKAFLDFFENKQHKIVDSAPMVIKDDPTLMFTNAGMNQFKDYFLGNKVPDVRRVSDTQKCLRVSGKHNDLEEVGIDTYHHTMFEMLGNWSFGDYFKKEAIAWAWELLTDVYGLPKDRLYVTIFEGDASEKLERDQEAYNFWKELIPENRILNGNKKDNFWEMGDTGPCGPCSEIHIDIRPESELDKIPGKDLVNQDHPLVIEIWNLVFMQFNRLANGTLENLPEQHVDTGMGFERLAMAIQGKTSNYDTDVFQPMIQYIAKKSNVEYGVDEKTDIALRVIVDHIRAITFAISDGQLPSNNKAGYVIRRILRRAVRYGYTFLGFKAPFMYELVEILASQFDQVFPELKEQAEFIQKVIQEEEASFLRTLEVGLKKMDEIVADVKAKNDVKVEGKIAFELYDTFGFPLDLTALIAREHGLVIDEVGFEKEMAEQKARSRKAAEVETGDWNILKEQDEITFIGYDNLEADASIVKYREVKQKKGSLYQIVLNQTPFYAESGGQVGDTGYIISEDETIKILDTKKENDLIVHFAEKIPASPESTFKAVVDIEKRKFSANNHSATHLLHAALKQVLGDHVQQKGSLVSDKVLRFDFSHFAKVTDEEISQIENIVNEKIRENISLDEKRNIPIKEAMELGATALFGEKYGEFVRVITFDSSYSIELCGGTHVKSTGEIGLFKIVAESSVAAGVRRIEAVTAIEAQNFVQSHIELLKEIKEALKNPKDTLKAVQQLLEDKSSLAKELEKLNLEKAGQIKQDLIKNAVKKDDVNCIFSKVKMPNADALKKLSYEIKNEVENVYMVLAANIAGKPQISVVVSESLISEKGLNAGQIVRELAKEIKGGGGGQPSVATAGGKDINGLDKVVEKAATLI